MNAEQIKEIAVKVITDGKNAGQTDDEIIMEMFSQKIPFAKLNATFKNTCIELGFMVDPSDVTDGVNEIIRTVDFEPMTEFAQIQKVIDHVVGEVDGATPKRVLTLIRAYGKENEIDIPKKPKGGSVGGVRGGKVPAAFVQLFHGDELPTKQEFYDTVLPLVKGHQNAIDYMNMFMGVCVAVKTGAQLTDAIESFKDQPTPEDANPVVEGDDDDNDEGDFE